MLREPFRFWRNLSIYSDTAFITFQSSFDGKRMLFAACSGASNDLETIIRSAEKPFERIQPTHGVPIEH